MEQRDLLINEKKIYMKNIEMIQHRLRMSDGFLVITFFSTGYNIIMIIRFRTKPESLNKCASGYCNLIEKRSLETIKLFLFLFETK